MVKKKDKVFKKEVELSKEKVKNKKLIETKECAHKLEEGDFEHLGDEIKIYYKCKECGCTVIEEYQFMRGYEMDKEGNIISKFY